jgi:hypothetical protein
MPKRDRLASSLFLVVPLRSAEGRNVLCDMIALCRQDTEVASRPGLEPEKYRCLIIDYDLKLDRFVDSLEPGYPLYKERRLIRAFVLSLR